MIAEKNNIERHFPGSQFTGPGTKIVSKIIQGIKPTSEVDNISRQHDVDYLMVAGNTTDALVADAKAIARSLPYLTLESAALKLGLNTRMATSAYTLGSKQVEYNKPIPGLTENETRRIGNYLDDQIKFEDKIEEFSQRVEANKEEQKDMFSLPNLINKMT